MALGLFLVGALIALVGLYLCITGAPAAPRVAAGFFDLLKDLPARFTAGVVLILLGGTMMGANFSALTGAPAQPTPSSAPASSAPSPAPASNLPASS